MFDPGAFLVNFVLGNPALDDRLQFNHLVLVGAQYFPGIGKYHAFALNIDLFARHIVKPEDDILGRYDDRLTIGRGQNIVGRHHQRAHFELRLDRQWYVYRHLVTVEIRVESGTYPRVQLNRLAFDQNRLERLDAQTMQSRCAVQEFQASQDALSSALSRLLVVVERYPDLKANQNFLTLQSQLEGTENRIAVARRDYIHAVKRYNTELRTIPGRWWREYLYPESELRENFTVAEDVQQVPKVEF